MARIPRVEVTGLAESVTAEGHLSRGLGLVEKREFTYTNYRPGMEENAYPCNGFTFA
jgi:hypothetical protein